MEQVRLIIAFIYVVFLIVGPYILIGILWYKMKELEHMVVLMDGRVQHKLNQLEDRLDDIKGE